MTHIWWRDSEPNLQTTCSERINHFWEEKRGLANPSFCVDVLKRAKFGVEAGFIQF